MLNVCSPIAGCGFSSVVGPIKTEYREPSIMPMIRYTVAPRCLVRAFWISLIMLMMPVMTPSPKTIRMGSMWRFRWSRS